MKKLYSILAVLLLCQIVTAQQKETGIYHRTANPNNNTNGFTGNSGTGANIDVTYHRCDWSIDPSTAKTISGTVTTYFRTITSNVSVITFDFNDASFNNVSLVVKYHGITCTKSFPSTNILSITLPSTIATTGTRDSVSITYSGNPPAVSGQAEGYQRAQDGLGNWYIYTLSESYEDRDWWPCKADMQDKIDSLDINLTVPNTYWVAAPGKLMDSAINGANRTFKYKHRYPIASYLVAIGVAKYNRYYRGTVTVGSKQVPVVYYIYPDITGSTLTNVLAKLDQSKTFLTTFSNLYGDYPFADEKHGYYQFGWGGGMEHQTFSAMGSSSLSSWSVIAHELGHQWFGDKVSFATWNHLWLAEGFAKYSEVLAAENVSVGTTPVSHRSSIKTTARSTNNTPIMLSSASIANSNTVWTTNNDNAVYQRGAMVVSMLRASLGDARFFQAMKNYIADPLLAYKSATTADMERNMEDQAGVDMSPFFTAWINGAGTPSYTGQYYVSGKFIQFKFTQTRVGGAVSHFPMPIVLKIANSGGTVDTTVVIYHHSATQLAFAGNGIGNPGANTISYNLSFVPASVSFDPDNVTMATGSMSVSATVLAVETNDLKARKAGSGNQVDLTVSSDEPVQKVILLKSSNGVDFTEAGEMMKTGGNAGKSQYSFSDNNPFVPTTFYRAKVVTSTSTALSNIAKVQQATISRLAVSPSPATDMIRVSFDNNEKQPATIRVLGVDGKQLFESTTKNDFIHYDVSTLAAGTYMVQIIQQGQVNEVARFLVAR